MCEFGNFPFKIERAIRALVALRPNFEANESVEVKFPQDESEMDALLVVAPEEETLGVQINLGIDVLVAVLLCMRLHAASDEGILVEKWQAASVSVAVRWPAFPHLLTLIQEALTWSPAQMTEALYNQQIDHAQRALGALLVGTSTSSDLEAIFYAHIFLLKLQSRSPVQEEAAASLAALVEKQWRKLTESPALFLAPRYSIPEILEACSSAASGHAKTAQILIAARLAVKVNVPKEIVAEIRRLVH